jgi:hypothetical protein
MVAFILSSFEHLVQKLYCKSKNNGNGKCNSFMVLFCALGLAKNVDICETAFLNKLNGIQRSKILTWFKKCGTLPMTITFRMISI